jgi:hypothetical protein
VWAGVFTDVAQCVERPEQGLRGRRCRSLGRWAVGAAKGFAHTLDPAYKMPTPMQLSDYY